MYIYLSHILGGDPILIVIFRYSPTASGAPALPSTAKCRQIEKTKTEPRAHHAGDPGAIALGDPATYRRFRTTSAVPNGARAIGVSRCGDLGEIGFLLAIF